MNGETRKRAAVQPVLPAGGYRGAGDTHAVRGNTGATRTLHGGLYAGRRALPVNRFTGGTGLGNWTS